MRPRLTPVEIHVAQRTPEWHVFRRVGGEGNPYPCAIGCSDLPALLGGDSEAIDLLWRRLSGLLPAAEPTYAMLRGRELEGEIIQRWRDALRVDCRPAVFYIAECPWFFASLDGICDLEYGSLVVEAKLHGAEDHRLVCDQEVPAKHRWQLQGQLVVAGTEWGHLVSGWDSGRGLETAIVHYRYEEGAAERILEAVEAMMRAVRDGKRPSRVSVAIAAPPAAGDPMGIPSLASPVGHRSPAFDAGETPAGDATVLVPVLAQAPGVITLLRGWVARRDEIVRQAVGLSIASKEDADAAGAVLKNLTALDAGIEEARKTATRPYDEAKRTIMDAVEEFRRPLAEAKEHVRGLVETWAEAERRARLVAEEERRRLENEVAAKLAAARLTGEASGAAAVAALTSLSVPERSTIANVAMGREPEFRVTNPFDVPRILCSPDEKLIRAAVRALWKSSRNEDAFLCEAADQFPGIEVTVRMKAKAR